MALARLIAGAGIHVLTVPNATIIAFAGAIIIFSASAPVLVVRACLPWRRHLNFGVTNAHKNIAHAVFQAIDLHVKLGQLFGQPAHLVKH